MGPIRGGHFRLALGPSANRRMGPNVRRIIRVSYVYRWGVAAYGPTRCVCACVHALRNAQHAAARPAGRAELLAAAPSAHSACTPPHTFAVAAGEGGLSVACLGLRVVGRPPILSHLLFMDPHGRRTPSTPTIHSPASPAPYPPSVESAAPPRTAASNQPRTATALERRFRTLPLPRQQLPGRGFDGTRGQMMVRAALLLAQLRSLELSDLF